MRGGVPSWVAQASRVLVSASRRNNLAPGDQRELRLSAEGKSAKARHHRQQAGRVRYPIKFAAL